MQIMSLWLNHSSHVWQINQRISEINPKHSLVNSCQKQDILSSWFLQKISNLLFNKHLSQFLKESKQILALRTNLWKKERLLRKPRHLKLKRRLLKKKRKLKHLQTHLQKKPWNKRKFPRRKRLLKMSHLHKRRLKALEVESLLDQSLEKMISQSKLPNLRKTKDLKLIQEQNLL